MKLSKEQIEQLYTFVRKKGLMYLDLQDEMVDHLANSIEDQINENPELTFEKALQIEYKKFGVFGFDGVYIERRTVLNNKSLKMYIKHLLSFFKLPKILLSICLFLAFKYLSYHTAHPEFIFYGINIMAAIYLFYLARWKYKDLIKLSEKYLVASQHNALMMLIFFIIVYVVDYPFITRPENIYSIYPNWLPLAMTMFIIQVLVTNELLGKLDSYIKDSGLVKN
jgi:hypothetical protein